MIKNLILDMGNVLIEFSPDRFISDLGVTDPEIHGLLLREIFQSREWVSLDHGAMDEYEAMNSICTRLPQDLHDLTQRLVFRWNEPLHPIAGMAELVKKCKAVGMGIYLLSNASVRQKEYWPDVPGSEWFDGVVVSADVQICKPNPDIYRYLMETYDLLPQECLFVDDMLYNVKGAEDVGMHAFHFQGDADALRQAIFCK